MSGRLTLRNLRIWDGRANGYAPARTLHVFGDRIASIGEHAPATASSRDCNGLTAVPGLIDAHVHMCLDPEADPAPLVPPEPESLAKAMARRAKAMVRAGITTARDLGGGTWAELELRDRIVAGALIGPRLLCAGQPITSPRGHCHFWGGEATDLEEAERVLARQVARGADLIKIMATGGNMTPGSNPVAAQFSEPLVHTIVATARRYGRRVAAHCHGTAGIGIAARAPVTTVEHCSWRGDGGTGTDFDPEIASALAMHGVWVSPTLNSSWRRHIGTALGDRLRENFEKMRAAGVAMIASTDAGIPRVPHDDLARALPVFSRLAGLTPVETLRAATSDGAAALGLEARVGTLDKGYSADIVLVEGSPLDDLEALSRPVAVMARGVFVDIG
jgi:imidazolonepropionase-like amidohydrolase